MINNRTVFALIAVAASCGFLFHISWVIWDLFTLWHVLKNTLYLNLINTMIFVYIIFFCLVWHRKMAKPEQVLVDTKKIAKKTRRWRSPKWPWKRSKKIPRKRAKISGARKLSVNREPSDDSKKIAEEIEETVGDQY